MVKRTPEDDRGIGQRIRLMRDWRELSQSELAGLAGISQSYLSRMERGVASPDKRHTVEALAGALEVAPSDLLKDAGPPRDPISKSAYAAIERISMVLAHNRIGFPFRERSIPWPELAARYQRFANVLVPACDYTGQAEMLPDLIEGLYATHAFDSGHRRDSLMALMITLQHTAALLKNLGAHGMPHLAATHMRLVADQLEDPAWSAVAEWRVGQSSAGDRARMLEVSLRALRHLEGVTDARARQAAGMLHLNAALATATLRRPDDARTHLDEAREMVQATEGASDFGDMHFGEPNWVAWRVGIGVELGEGPKVREIARELDVTQLPAAERRGMLYGDVARGLAQDKATRDDAILMMRQAEKTAPQRIRTNPYMKEVVGDLMRRRQRDAVGRELRGMAWRMGLAG